MANLTIGKKVKYLDGDKWKSGVIHGIKKVGLEGSGMKVIGYLVDTGKDERLDEIATPEGEDNIFIRQPEQVEVTPDNIKLASE